MNTDDLKNAADRHLRDGRLPEALDAYARLCNMAPGNAKAWYMQATVSGMLGQFDNTVHCCEKALAIKPNAAAVYASYASALVELKRYADAVRAFQRAIELNPADPGSLNRLGNLYRVLNKPAEAEACFRKVIAIAPDTVNAFSNLAHILKESGRFRESIGVCEKALSTGPIDRVVLTTLLECYFITGENDKACRRIVSAKPLLKNLETPLYKICWKLHANRKYAESISAIQTILKIFPENGGLKLILADCQIQQDACHDAIKTLSALDKPLPCEAHLLLVQAYKKTNQQDKAAAQLAEAGNIYPDEESPVILLARNLIESGKSGEARLQLESFIEKHPDSHRVLVELGSIDELDGNQALAETRYSQAISAQPQYAIAHNRLGVLYQNSEKYSLAQECFEKAIQCNPGLLTAACNLARLHCINGEYSKAQDCYGKVLEKDPGFEEAITGKAIVLDRQGKVTESLELVEPLVRSGTENLHTLIAYANASSAANKESAAAKLLESALDCQEILPADRKQAYFVLGKLLDQTGNYDQAFAYYKQGNELNPFSFDRNAHQQLVDAMLAVFTPGNMKIFPVSSNQTDKLIFIVGMPRSGTTLTEQILASHPGVFGAGELSHIIDIAAAIPGALGSQRSFPLDMPGISKEVLDRFSFEYTKTLVAMTDGQMFITDKMPANFMFLGLIELLFPNARVLHCVRDPMDTCLSCYFQNFSRGQYFSNNQSDLAFYYRQYQRLMNHWKSILSIPIMDIRYEELVNDQETTSRKMLEFAGLDWHTGCLDFHKSRRKIRTASYGQVRKPVYKSSVRRWKNYERHLTQLKQALCR